MRSTILFTTFFCLIAFTFYSCLKEEKKDSKEYICVTGTCTEVTFGDYSSLADCETACAAYTYNCNNGSCTLASSGSGTYGSLSECQTLCNPVRWQCQSGNCVSSATFTTGYTRQQDCENSCSSSVSYGYNCVNNSCTFVQTGATYATQTDCANNCSSGSTAGYDCVSGNCTYVQSGATFATQTDCQNNCSSASTSGYNCDGAGGCFYVGSNATYSTRANCLANCTTTPTTGKLMVWSSDPTPCPAGHGTTITVKLNGTTYGTIGQYFTSEPVCGNPGALTLDLAPGSYEIDAGCHTNLWPLVTVQVTAGGCVKHELTDI